jgi:hypothetical protein
VIRIFPKLTLSGRNRLRVSVSRPSYRSGINGIPSVFLGRVTRGIAIRARREITWKNSKLLTLSAFPMIRTPHFANR